MIPKMGPLFENLLASRGAQIRNDYDKDFFFDADYESSNIFVRSTNNQQSIIVDVTNIKLDIHNFYLDKILVYLLMISWSENYQSCKIELQSWCLLYQHRYSQCAGFLLRDYEILSWKALFLWLSHSSNHSGGLHFSMQVPNIIIFSETYFTFYLL